MRHPLGSICRVTEEFRIEASKATPAKVVRKTNQVVAQGLRDHARRPNCFLSVILLVSCSSSARSFCVDTVAGKDELIGVSLAAADPFRECAGFQFTLLLGRRIRAADALELACVSLALGSDCAAFRGLLPRPIGLSTSSFPCDRWIVVSIRASALLSDEADERLCIEADN